CPPKPNSKGRLKNAKRNKGGKELAKQKYSSGFCTLQGHNTSTCPDKPNELRYCGFCELNGHYSSACPNKPHEVGETSSCRKKKKVTAKYIGINPIYCVKY
ncbi:hypothetical protein MKX03_021262, partial [Papaver bracteatum]